jgi:cytochrome oxidase assembly protein ShyY1
VAHPLLAPKKIVRHVFVLLVVAGCVVAGFWQIARLHEVRVYNASVRRQIAAAPRPIDGVLPPGVRVDPRSVQFRRVTATGRYDVRGEVILAGRTRRDNPGNAVLTPLVLTDGRTVVVDRGWVRFGMDRPPVAGAMPPPGTVTVTGVLFPPDATSAPSRTPVTVMTKVDLGRIAGQLPSPGLPVYLWLQKESPRRPGRFPIPLGLPALSEGPHFSYAVQWFLFATVGLIGYPILLSRERRRPHRREAAPTKGTGPTGVATADERGGPVAEPAPSAPSVRTDRRY